jgi:hypothetical protein
MKSPFSDVSKSVRVNSENIQHELSQVIVHLEATTRRVADARFLKIAMKSTEVLKGLRTLFERLGAEDQTQRTERSSSTAREAKGSERSGEVAGKKSTKPGRKLARSAKPASSPAASSGKKPVTAPDPSIAKVGTRTRKPAPSVPAPEPAAQSTSLPPVAAPKPEDPDDVAAKARLQQKEARAPQRPGGRAAPRPLPPQSGKPTWSKPHSS